VDENLPQDLELAAGTQVGEYVIEGKLGAGAFGDVYRAKHPVIGKAAAVKVLGKKHSADPEVVSRFVTEARVVNQVHHPNIVDIFSFGQLEDGRHYHIMELLDGEPLDEHVAAQGGRLSVATVVELLIPLARALDAAHAAGVVHRDLKPANVFLATAGDGTQAPKLLDFGIAKLLGDDLASQHQTATGVAVGTPEYMSPEQCEGKTVDHRSDVYALGCMAFRMITGRPVFEEDSVVALLMAHIQKPPLAPSELAPDLPASVDAPVLAMLAKSPDARPSSASAAIEALPLVGGDRVATAPQAALHEPSVSGLRSIPAPTGSQSPVVIVAALVAVVVVGYLAFALPGSGDAEVKPTAAVEAPPAPPKAPALPVQVEIRFDGVPDGTIISGPDGVLATAPEPARIPRGDRPMTIELTRDGYVTAQREVTPSASTTLTVELEKVAKAAAKPGGKPTAARKPPATRKPTATRKPKPAEATPAAAEPAPAVEPGKNDIEDPFAE